MAKHTIVLIPGDGIGPEVTAAGRRVLEAAGLSVEWVEVPAGASALSSRIPCRGERGADSTPRPPAARAVPGRLDVEFQLARAGGRRVGIDGGAAGGLAGGPPVAALLPLLHGATDGFGWRRHR